MADHEGSERSTQSEQQEPVFVPRAIRVGDQDCAVIVENAPCLLERDALLVLIGGILALVPLKSQIAHKAMK